MYTFAVNILTKLGLYLYNGGKSGGGIVVWLQLLKEYCRTVKPTNLWNALLSWFAYKNFETKSWNLFLRDICIIANITENSTWKKYISKNKYYIPFLLNKTIFPFYIYLYYSKNKSFFHVFINDMIVPEERNEFLSFIKPILEITCEDK